MAKSNETRFVLKDLSFSRQKFFNKHKRDIIEFKEAAVQLSFQHRQQVCLKMRNCFAAKLDKFRTTQYQRTSPSVLQLPSKLLQFFTGHHLHIEKVKFSFLFHIFLLKEYLLVSDALCFKISGTRRNINLPPFS